MILDCLRLYFGCFVYCVLSLLWCTIFGESGLEYFLRNQKSELGRVELGPSQKEESKVKRRFQFVLKETI